MQIIIEGKTVDFDLPRKDIQLNEVIEEIETFLYTVGKIPCTLSINGKQLTQEDLEKMETTVLKGTETLDIGVKGIFEFVCESLDGAQVANKELIKLLQNFTDQLRKDQANADNAAILDEINHFFDFWLKLHGLIPDQFNGLNFGSRTITQLFEEFKTLLGEAMTSMEKSDNVYAADLMEYEIKPMIELVDRAIPTLKSRIETLRAQELAEASSSTTS